MSVVNIACSAPDCHNPVIGQCTGYKKTCGKYYCREHSTDTLCFDCSSEKAAEEHAEVVYKEYLALAEKVLKDPISIPKFQFQGKKLLKISGCSLAIGGVMFFLLIILIIVGIVWNDLQALIWVLLILGALALALIGWPFGIVPLIWLTQYQEWTDKERHKVISARIKAIEQEKQGFTQFWNAWVKQRREERAEKNRQALMGVLAVVGAIAAGAVAAGLSESEYDRTRRAVRDEMNSR